MVSLLELMAALKEKKKGLTVLGLNSTKKERERGRETKEEEEKRKGKKRKAIKHWVQIM